MVDPEKRGIRVAVSFRHVQTQHTSCANSFSCDTSDESALPAGWRMCGLLGRLVSVVDRRRHYDNRHHEKRLG